jgi:hypothetical protein
VRSWEFLFALVCFLTPTAIAAGLVYRRVVNSRLCRPRGRARLTDAHVRQLAERPETPPPAPAPAVPEPVPAPAASAAQPPLREIIQQPLATLRQRLTEFRASLQQTGSALQQLQDGDCRLSMDLNMQQAFAEPRPKLREVPRRGVSPAA